MIKMTVFILFAAYFCVQASSFLEYPESRQIGPFEVYEMKGHSFAPTIVYLHGWGGNGLDAYEMIREFSQQYPELKHFNWVFPNSPRGAEWFKMHFDENGIYTDNWASELKSIRKKLDAFFKALKIPTDQIILGGFSQGGITAVDYVVHSPHLFQMLLVNNVRYFKDKTHKYLKKPEMKYAITHGRQDDLFSKADIKDMEKLLKSLGMKGKTLWSPAGHHLEGDVLVKSLVPLQKDYCKKYFK